MSNNPTPGIVSLIVVLLLGLLLRWVFKPSRSNRITTRPVDASESTSLGLLSVVESGLSRQDALSHRATLQDAGIRSSMSKRRDGSLDVLVFHGDVDAARVLLNV